jgi:hypothetical protein
MTTINQLTRDDIVTAAIGKLGVLAAEQTPTADDLAKGSMFLNTLLAELRAIGMPLWARTTYSFSPTANVSSYTIGVGQTLPTPYPLKLLQAYIISTAVSSSRLQMDIISDYNYNYLPVTASTGRPLQISYQPNVNYGIIKVWPTPSDSESTITIVYQRPYEYFNSSTDTLDFPEEWYNAIIYKLAVLLAPDWGIPLESRQMLRVEAKEMLDTVLSFGTEDASFYFQPGR